MKLNVLIDEMKLISQTSALSMRVRIEDKLLIMNFGGKEQNKKD